MSELLRILILEDNPADAEMAQFELQEAGIVFEAKVAKNEEEYLREIREYCPDLILSDYDLPKYNGALALEEATKRCPDTPFILVTGAVTEDRAIDILTRGAKDYVLKNRLQQRLAPAVKRAIAEAEEYRARKRAEAELREAHRTLEEKVRIRTVELEAEMASRKRMEAMLRESHGRTAAILESIADAFYSLDDQWRFVEVNRAAERAPFGRAASELLGKVIWELFPAIVGTRTHQAYLDAVEKRSQEHYEAQSPLNGRWYEVFMFPRERGIDVYLRDITERKQAEEALRERESRERARLVELQAFMDAVPGLVLIAHDPRCRKMTGNRATNEFLRLQPGDNLSKSAFNPEKPLTCTAMKNGVEVPPEELPVQQAAKGREIRDYEVDIVFRDGVIRTMLGNASPVFDERGNPRGAIGVFVDVTDRKRAEKVILRGKELSDALNRINEAVHSTLSAVGIMQTVIDQGAAALGGDSAAISLREGSGWTVSHVCGMPANMVGSRMRDEQERHALLACQSRQPVAVSDAFNDDRFNREHFRTHNVQAVLAAPLIIKGEPVGVIFFNYHAGPHLFTQEEVDFARKLAAVASIALENARLFDKIKRVDDSLRLQTQLLRESSKELQSFTYSVSHDLRAPLGAIEECTGMILRMHAGKFDEELLGKFNVITDNTRRMGQLIDDLLACSPKRP